MARRHTGFSLIEVLISIAVLSIVAMFLLSYFSSANLYTSTGKSTQKADMAGQSVLEELEACETFSQIEEDLVDVSGSDWSVTATTATSTEMVKTPVTIDGTDYQARVTLDYDYSTTDEDGGTTTSQYNDYDSPQLTDIYSQSNAILTESDQTSVAVSHFYYIDTSVAKADIKAAMTRVFTISIAKNDTDSALYDISIDATYTYDGSDYTENVGTAQAEVSVLRGIYFFYQAMRDDIETEYIEIDMDSNITIDEAKDISLYLICEEGDVEPPINYQISISGDANYLSLSYNTNGINVSGVSANTNLVSYSKGKRIAAITVDVYSASATEYTEDTRLVRLQTSKGA